jgi:uncharacterized protein (TIGR02646 family)
MIQLVRPPAPQNLTKKGRAARTKLEGEFRKRRNKFKPIFNEKIYQSVKDHLISAQHGKCAYCESNVTATGYGDVEHYRPKGGFCQNVGDDLTQPGYFWLAYEWTNLLFSCQLCNEKFKENLFPLADPAKRATSPDDVLSQEEPLLLNPYEDNPDAHLDFAADELVGISPKGEKTIEILGLNRPELRLYRFKFYNQISELVESLHWFQEQSSTPEIRERITSIEKVLNELKTSSSSYAAMVRALLR